MMSTVKVEKALARELIPGPFFHALRISGRTSVTREFFCYTFACLLCLSPQTLAAEIPQSVTPELSRTGKNHYIAHAKPFMPEKRDYVGELGGMWENTNLYWIGGNLGFHVGSCLFSSNQNCQQYIDVIGGVGGRDSQTHTLVLGSLRWQWINFPASWSPIARIFGGVMNSHLSSGVEKHPAFGIGFGTSAYMHERADLRLEVRLGYAESKEPFAQLFFGIQIKMNQWVSYFGEKLKSLGIDTFETVKEAGEVITKPFLPNESNKKQDFRQDDVKEKGNQ